MIQSNGDQTSPLLDGLSSTILGSDHEIEQHAAPPDRMAWPDQVFKGYKKLPPPGCFVSRQCLYSNYSTTQTPLDGDLALNAQYRLTRCIFGRAEAEPDNHNLDPFAAQPSRRHSRLSVLCALQTAIACGRVCYRTQDGRVALQAR